MPNAMEPAVTVYSVAEVAKHLHLSRQYIEQLLRSDELHGTRVGRRWLIRADILQAFIDDHTHNGE